MSIYQNLPESEVQMLISAYKTKLNKIVKPLQRFETGIEICHWGADAKHLKKFDKLWSCEPVNFKNRMDDHNYRVGLGTPDSLTDVVYTRKFRNSSVYREWYLTEIRAKYNDYYFKITMLAQYVGYDYSHLVGQLNFTELEQASMDWYLEHNARGPVAADGWEGY